MFDLTKLKNQIPQILAVVESRITFNESFRESMPAHNSEALVDFCMKNMYGVNDVLHKLPEQFRADLESISISLPSSLDDDIEKYQLYGRLFKKLQHMVDAEFVDEKSLLELITHIRTKLHRDTNFEIIHQTTFEIKYDDLGASLFPDKSKRIKKEKEAWSANIKKTHASWSEMQHYQLILELFEFIPPWNKLLESKIVYVFNGERSYMLPKAQLFERASKLKAQFIELGIIDPRFDLLNDLLKSIKLFPFDKTDNTNPFYLICALEETLKERKERENFLRAESTQRSQLEDKLLREHFFFHQLTKKHSIQHLEKMCSARNDIENAEHSGRTQLLESYPASVEQLKSRHALIKKLLKEQLIAKECPNTRFQGLSSKSKKRYKK